MKTIVCGYLVVWAAAVLEKEIAANDNTAQSKTAANAFEKHSPSTGHGFEPRRKSCNLKCGFSR